MSPGCTHFPAHAALHWYDLQWDSGKVPGACFHSDGNVVSKMHWAGNTFCSFEWVHITIDNTLHSARFELHNVYSLTMKFPQQFDCTRFRNFFLWNNLTWWCCLSVTEYASLLRPFNQTFSPWDRIVVFDGSNNTTFCCWVIDAIAVVLKFIIFFFPYD